jgi:dTDP-4-dehydrorhamnose reductase
LHSHHEEIDGRLELWGGHECTVNRVGDSWFDQTVISGHEHRPGDLALFAELGVRKLRYPALWERIAPEHPDRRDFRWTDERIAEIARLGMEPILTLCHHGSGPRYTSLLDEGFASGLAAHAAVVAARYPHVGDYTPVNEPLTTARFSAAYGYWYPHARDERSFWLALLNEIDATRLAMRAIRAVNPAARLIQTDDLGFCHATPSLAGEAAFQNERRWMGWDLLCGTVKPGHALWARLVRFGLEDRLRVIADDPCPPDVIGVNHYPSSERLLDHRIELRADRSIADAELGDFGGLAFVDVDAARAEPDWVIGLSGLIEQAWRRYGRPVAITEAHHGSTRDEQARWLVDIWKQAEALRAKGVDVPAVTAWALLGSHDWNRMVTRFIGHYEPGVFDLRGPEPRPTLAAFVLKGLADGERSPHPALKTPGWWTEERRTARTGFEIAHGPRAADAARPLMIVSGDPVLTTLAADACEMRGLHYVVANRLDKEHARALRPWAILATAAVDGLAPVCEAVDARGACFDRAVGSRHDPAAHLLIVRAAPVFTADDGSVAIRFLDAIDAGEEPQVEPHVTWREVYGPTLLDGVLGDLQRELACVARWTTRPNGIDGLVPHAATAPGTVPDLMPPLETMLERFVSDRRRVRGMNPVRREDGLALLAAE